jgi:TonB-linked SusC/RagA family outer membrane protein
MQLNALCKGHGLHGLSNQTMRVMKLTALLITVVCLSVSGRGLSQKVTFSGYNVSLEKVFSVIEQQTGYYVMWNYSFLRNSKPVTISVKNVSVESFLESVLKEQHLDYVIKDKTIFIRSKVAGKEDPLSNLINDPPPPITVRGRIVSEGGDPMESVTVTVKGTNKATSTDANGEFELNDVDEKASLVVTGVNIETREMRVTENMLITVTSSVSLLKETVVIGYGTRQKSQLTGSIASVQSSEIKAVPVISVGQALQGRAPGVDVSSTSNVPGGGVSIRVRGTRSITADNEPLYVVDGIPLSGGINDINPNIIESIEVLKDASATAIYGARGANGVILVTTKRGNTGKTIVTLDSYIGVSSIANRVNALDAEGWVAYKSASLRTDQLNMLLDPIEIKNYNEGKQVNWLDFVLREGIQQNHSVGISGGNQKTQFFVNANFVRQEGIIKNSDFTRGSIQINLDHRVNDRFRIGTSTMISMSKENILNQGSILGQAMTISPLGEVFNADGTYRLFPTTEALSGNPLTDLQGEKNQRVRTRLFSSIYGEYEFLKGLKYRVNFGPDLTFEDRGRFIGSNTTQLQGALNRATSAKADTKAYTLENLLTYVQNFGESHKMDITLLQSMQRQNFTENVIEAQGLPSEKLLWHDMSAGQIRTFDSNEQGWSLLSYMARINYGFKDKYLFTITARRDGSSRFGEDRKIGYFPSAAFAWRIVEENFMQQAEAISDLKLRISYGSIGNTALNPYQSMGSLSRRPYLFGADPALGFEPNTLPNAELQWETSKQFNVGLDFGLLNNRVSGSVEFYQIRTTDLLLNRALPPSTGFQSILSNIGSTKNTGYEFNVKTNNLSQASTFRWTTSLNLAFNKNEIVDLYGSNVNDVGNKWFIGEPISVHYDMVFDGIWQEKEAADAALYGRIPGQIKVKDLNNDKIINADDRAILGSPFPKWTGGMTNTFTYKNFDLSVFINTRQKFMITSELYASNNLEGRYNIPEFINYYTPARPSNDFPQPVKAGSNNPNLAVLQYRDASFIRLRNVSLSYTFSNKMLKPVGVQSLRLYVTGYNLYTSTDFKGWDPEAGNTTGSYPNQKMILLGMNASF